MGLDADWTSPCPPLELPASGNPNLYNPEVRAWVEKNYTKKRFISTATPLPRFTPKPAFDAVYDTFSNPPPPIGAARNAQPDTILAPQAYPVPPPLRAPSSYP